MLLTEQQLYEIRQIVMDHHTAFIVNTISPSAVAPEILERLKEKGLVDVKVNSIEDSYLYGQVMAMMDNPQFATMTYDQFKQHLQKNPVPLNNIEQQAIKTAQMHAGQYCQGLGNKVGATIGSAGIEADAALRQKMRDTIKTETALNVAKRESVKKLKSRLGWETGDWSRDWQRIANTEKQNAMQRGVADNYAKQHGGDVRVAKRPMPSACFVPGTLITTQRGEVPIEGVRVGDMVLTHRSRWRKVTALMDRPYVGQVYGFNGRQPSMTDNHPILVDLDWRRADSVQSGDYLVGFDSVGVTQNDPSLFLENVSLSTVSVDGRAVGSMPVSSIKLNRYLQLRDSDIDVEYVDGHFQNGREICQSLEQTERRGGSSNLFVLARESFFTSGFWGHRQLVSFARVCRELFSLGFSHAFQPSLLAYALGGEGQTPFQKSSFNDSPADLKMLSNRDQRVFSRFGHSGKFGLGDLRTRHYHQSFHVEKVQTIAIERFEGIVYNFEVADDHSYVADGLIVHNCKHCLRLNLGPDGQPRIFKLSELEANGTNVGRKAADWKAVVGVIHPNCACQLVRVPKGWGFDEEGSLIPGGELGIQYGSEEDVQKAMREEMDLQKAFKLAGHTEFQGIPIAIENTVGSERKWRDGLGGVGTSIMKHAYGYIERTTGADEDEVDVFLGPDPRAEQAYIIHQRNVHTDLYDEDKIMLGFSNERDALAAYNANYDRNDFIITVTPMEMEAFKRWVQSSEARPGEMFKSGTGGVRYVIPLQVGRLAKSQAGKLASEAATTLATTEAARGPVSGTGSNYQAGVKPRERAAPVEGLKETLEDVQEDEENRKTVRRDKETYHFVETQRHSQPFEVPEDFKSDALETEQIADRRKHIQKISTQNRGVTRNTVDPEDSAQETPK